MVEIRAERAWPGGAPHELPLLPASRGEAALSGLQAAAEVERSPVPVLAAAAVARAFGAARRRLLVLDYGGTLVTRSHVVGEATGRQAHLGFQLDGYAENLPQDVAQALARLAADPATVAYLVSGLRSAAIQALLVAQTPQIGLAAENGMFVSHPAAPPRSASGAALAFRLGETFGSPSSIEAEGADVGFRGVASSAGVGGAPAAAAARRQWESLSPADAARMAAWQGVKQRAVSIMTDYVWRVNGSAVLEYDSLVAWDFRNADPEWAVAQAHFVAQDLEQLALSDSPHDVKVTVRKSRVEVCLRALDKGTVVTELLRRLGREPAGSVDFVLCVGDDTTDEDMFAAVSSWAAEGGGGGAGGGGAAPAAVFTATVGKKSATRAGAFLPDVASVQALVLSLDAAARAAASSAASAVSAVAARE